MQRYELRRPAIKALRAFVKQHRTQREAAEALSMAQSFLTELLQGKKPFPERVLNQLGLMTEIVPKDAA